MIEVFMTTTALSDGSKVHDVEVAIPGQDNTVRFNCHNEQHAIRLVAVISECIDVEMN